MSEGALLVTRQIYSSKGSFWEPTFCITSKGSVRFMDHPSINGLGTIYKVHKAGNTPKYSSIFKAYEKYQGNLPIEFFIERNNT